MSQQFLPASAILRIDATDLPTKTLTQVTYALLNDTAENDITNLTFTALNNDIDASLDMTEVDETSTIRLVEEVDATTSRQIKEWIWPTDNDSVNDEVLKISIIGHGVAVKVTIESSVAETGNIPIAIAEYIY